MIIGDVTIGIHEGIDEELQIEIWNIIDRLKSMRNFSIDYLQIFELKKIENTREFNNCYNQEIVHIRNNLNMKSKYF